jgi:uncharacterized protein YcbK (DUF882 family)
MGDLSPNFSRNEFACKGKNCCDGSAPISPILTRGLEELRYLVTYKLKKDTPLIINSGFRCNRHNKAEGCAANSQHTLGTGADVRTPAGMTDDEFAELAERVEVFSNGGIGIYNGRIHVDVRRQEVRWDNR